jgi:hypothetical protein
MKKGSHHATVKDTLDFRGLNIKKNGDDFIIEKSDDPNAMPALASEITGRIDAGALASLSNLGARQNSPDYVRNGDLNIRTQRATQHDDSIAKTLLRNSAMTREMPKEDPNPFKNTFTPEQSSPRASAPPDDRPLIDLLHEATFGDSVGMQWIEDKYGLRTLIRKAHCFTLDSVTSALVSDFSMAIAKDLESARRMAIPPFPVTWIDLDNIARLQRIKALGVGLTSNAANDAVARVGWLIHPDTINGGHYATYACQVDQGVTLAPLSYWWHTEATLGLSPRLKEMVDTVDVDRMDRLSFGVRNSGVSPMDAVPSPTPMHIKLMANQKYPPQVQELMTEIGGELRHIWGFLIALGAGQLGMEAKYSDQPKPTTVKIAKNGKPLLPLEHKVLHLHLAKRMTVEKVIARSITHHKHRWHEVRSHFRLLKSGKRVPVKSHERGDERLGRIEKAYRVER